MKTKKLEAAKKAIEDVGCDTSLPLETTLEQLEELRDDLEARINGLKGDLRMVDG